MRGVVAEFQRRGGSTIASDPNDASSYPTTPPASTHTHFNSVPEIGGSEGGFIGLIVGLSVLFIGSCIGVFFLLRNWKHGGRTVFGKSGEVGVDASAAGPGFPRRRGTLFGFRSQNPKQDGWVRAPGEDEDEWDANDTLGMGPYDPVKENRNTYSGRSELRGEVEVPNLDYRHPDRKDESSVSTIDLEAPGHVTRDDPFEPPIRTTSPSLDDALASYPKYVDHLNMKKDGQPRQTSHDSAETIVALPGGTKFKEDL